MSNYCFVSLVSLLTILPGYALGQSKGGNGPSSVDASPLLDAPPPVPEHLRELFDRMEAANRRSQDVFRQLSIEQGTGEQFQQCPATEPGGQTPTGFKTARQVQLVHKIIRYKIPPSRV